METTTGLRERLAAAVLPAMRSRDRELLRVLRATLGVIDNAEAVPVTTCGTTGAAHPVAMGAGATDVPRRTLTELEVVGLVRAEVEERERAATTYDDQRQGERASTLRREARLLRDLLDA